MAKIPALQKLTHMRRLTGGSKGRYVSTGCHPCYPQTLVANKLLSMKHKLKLLSTGCHPCCPQTLVANKLLSTKHKLEFKLGIKLNFCQLLLPKTLVHETTFINLNFDNL